MTCTLLVSTCQRPVVELTEVLNYSSCKSLPSGATWISFNELGKVRGVALEVHAPAPPVTQKFLAISNGRQPTGGYAFSLSSYRASGRDLILELDWISPEPDTLTSAALTSPCLVIGIQAESAVGDVTVHLDSAPFATVAFPN